MSPQLLAAVGEALYGGQWQSALAADLKVNLRSLQRWAAGEFMPRAEAQAGLLADIRKLLIARGRALERVLAMVDKASQSAQSKAE